VRAESGVVEGEAGEQLAICLSIEPGITAPMQALGRT
jgi:hypothetical protein